MFLVWKNREREICRSLKEILFGKCTKVKLKSTIRREWSEKTGLFQVLFLQDMRTGLEYSLDVLRIYCTGKIWNTKLSAQRLLLGFLVSRLDLLMKLIFILERVVVDIGESIVVGIVSDDVAGAHGSIVADSAC